MSILLRTASFIPILACFGPATHAQYGLWVNSITNSASYAVSGQNGYGIAQGSMFVVFGWNIGPYQLQQANTFPLPTQVGGTSIQVTVGKTSWNAIMIYSSAYQVAAILPSAVTPGDGTLTLSYNGYSIGTPIKVLPSAFGIYTLTSNGIGAGVITTTDYKVEAFTDAAHPGDVLIIWGTGLGPVAGDEAAGPLPGTNFPNTEVFVGGQSATILYAGRSGCCAALDQIAFRLPAGLSGCFVPIAVRSGGIVSNFVTVPIASQGHTCSDPIGPPASLLAKAQGGQAVTVGMIGIGSIPVLQGAGFPFLSSFAEQFSNLLGVKISEQDLDRIVRARGAERLRAIRKMIEAYGPLLNARKISLRDVLRLANAMNNAGAAAGFTQLNGLNSVVSQFAGIFPPAGTCTVVRSFPFNSHQWGASGSARDAGAQLVLSGPMGARNLNRVSTGQYQADLGSALVDGELPPGTYSITGIGGVNIGPFTTSMAGGGTVQWTNRSTIATVNRLQPLTMTWSAQDFNGYIVLGGASSGSDLRSAFVCVEESRKQTFTVPAYILNSMAPAAADRGYLFLTKHPFQNPFAAPGIDLGYFIDFSTTWKELAFQ